jgi:protease stability complex PrcB-like protein
VSHHVRERTDLPGRECGGPLRERRTRAASRSRPFWRVLALVVFGIGPGCKATVQVASLPFEVIVQDAGMKQAGTEPPAAPSYRFVRDAGTWESYWRNAFGTTPPAVDFAREFVLCVQMGTKPTGGYAIAVREVQFDAERRRLDCTLELTEPAPGTLLIQALTSPYAIYRVSLPTGLPVLTEPVEIRFHREERGAKVPVDLRRVQ